VLHQVYGRHPYDQGVAGKRRPTPEERDERVKVDLDPDEFVEGVLAAGPHPDEGENDEDPAAAGS